LCQSAFKFWTPIPRLRGSKYCRPNDTKDVGLSPKTPQGRHKIKVISSELPDGSHDPEQRFISHFESRTVSTKAKSFAYLQTGVLEPEDTSDFHDEALLAVVGPMGRIEYASL
jgi:hypothetical protein